MNKSVDSRGRIAAALCTAACILLCLMYPNTVLQAAKNGFSLFVNSLLPTLFPGFVLTSVLVKTGVLSSMGKGFSHLFGRLGLPGEAAPLFILGGISGYPVGAKLSAGLEGKISRNTLERLCSACNMASPMFITGTVATAMLGEPRLGLVLLCAHWLGALAVLLLPIGREKHGQILPEKAERPAFSFTDALLSSIADGMQAMLRVCGALMLFNVLTAMVGLFMPFAAGSLPEALLTAFLEKSAGCAAVAALSLPLAQRAALCSFIVAFGGCSVLLQTLFFAGVRVSRYWSLKLLHAAVSGGITLILLL